MSVTSRGRVASIARDRFLSQEACRELLDRVVRLSTGGGEVQIYVSSRWIGNIRWARNQIITAGDTSDHQISIFRSIQGASGQSTTNRLDDASLRACIQRCEERIRYGAPNSDYLRMRSAEHYLATNLWSDSTFELDAAGRADIQRLLVEPAIVQQLASAGYVEVSAAGNGVVNTSGLFAYIPETRAEYSVTVRNAKGTGSGWAGVANKDWRQIDAERISATALDKCQRSADPMAIEPGRYTVVLEPQAVADLMTPLVQSLWRVPAELGNGPWADRSDASIPSANPGSVQISGSQGGGRLYSKITQKVLDERITISADPADPQAPFVPFWYDSTPMRRVKWIDSGVLKELAYDRSYALSQLNKPDPLNNSSAFRMSGGPTSIAEMIATTERGLLVTRLVNVRGIDFNSLLQTGTTADGLWLIERGKLTTPVKNFRFRESPLFAFNNLEALGPPVRVLSYMPTIVPPAKVRDFSMTSLADAV